MEFGKEHGTTEHLKPKTEDALLIIVSKRTPKSNLMKSGKMAFCTEGVSNIIILDKLLRKQSGKMASTTAKLSIMIPMEKKLVRSTTMLTSAKATTIKKVFVTWRKIVQNLSLLNTRVSICMTSFMARVA